MKGKANREMQNLIPDIILLMRQGFSHDKISFGMNINDLMLRLGQPDSTMGNGEMGYLLYGSLRIGYFKTRYEYQFRVKLHNLEENERFIHKNMRMHNLIKLFNNNGVSWRAGYRKCDLDYATLYVENGSEVTFELEDGNIWWIAFSPPNQSEK